MSTSNRSVTKSSQVSRATGLIAGAKKRFPNANEVLAFGGTTSTVAQVLAALQAIIDLRAAAEQAKAAATAKVAAEQSQLPPAVAVMRGFTSFVRSRFGSDPEALGDFDLSPRKAPTPKTAEEKAVSVAKAQATREARHTMGPKAKQSVKGSITAELVVTPTTTEPANPPKPQATTPHA